MLSNRLPPPHAQTLDRSGADAALVRDEDAADDRQLGGGRDRERLIALRFLKVATSCS